MSFIQRYIVFIVLGLALVFLGFTMYIPSPPANAFAYDLAGQLPVQQGGRVKPWDTLARVSLLVISNRQTYRDEDKKEHPAIQWLLDVMTSGLRRAADGKEPEYLSAEEKKFRVEDPESRRMLGLEDRPDPLYSFNELQPKWLSFLGSVKDRLEQLAGRAPEPLDLRMRDLALRVDEYAEYAPFETRYNVFRIDNLELQAMLELPRRDGLRYAWYEIVPRIYDLNREYARVDPIPDKDRNEFEAAVAKLKNSVELYRGLAEHHPARLQMVPPLKPSEKWRSLAEVLRDREPSPALEGIRQILGSYAKDDQRGFNKAVADYRRLVDEKVPQKAENSRFESFFNHFEPFTQCIYLYVIMFLLGCTSWIVWERPLGRAAFWLGLLIMAVHGWALYERMQLQGRPPVTNLYSSAVFAGWIAVALGLVLEAIFPYGIAAAAAAIAGGGTALFAHHLAGSGDTMEMMQAVLDTNFWLATHVVAVTIGYGSTILAGILGVAFVVRGVLTPSLRPELVKGLSTMIYGILCFATLFSFTGTVLGGIWADQSWGRFWGWDPKENGALIIVIWNALILHARWAGMVKQRGMAVLSVVGIMVTMWSWIGTNQLGVGLHAYGFNNTLAMIADGTWFACIAVLAMGLIPTRHWQSFQKNAV
jgi:ABC-type transport system involved in cytochrome c biogenesis permease subunit